MGPNDFERNAEVTAIESAYSAWKAESQPN